MLMIVILLFNLLFRSMSSLRGVRRTAVQMPMLRGSRGWLFFGFRNTRCGKSSRCWLGPSALFLPWNRLHACLSTHKA